MFFTQGSWRVPNFTIALIIVTLLSYYYGYIKFEFSFVSTDENSPEEPDLLYGDDFEFWENIGRWVRSKRGEKFITYCFVSFFVFWGFHLLARVIIKALVSHKVYSSLSQRNRFFLAQKVCSSIHGAATAIIAVKLLFIDRLFDNDIIDSYNVWCDILFALSFGYEVYDFFIMYIQTGAAYLMYVHHAALLLAYFLIVTHKKTAFVGVTMLITEFTVVPSNIHWYFKIFKKRYSRIFHFNQGLRLWSFLALRLTCPPLAYYGLIRQFDQLYHEEVYIIYIACFGLVSLLTIMNIHWTRLMFGLYINRITYDHKTAIREVAQRIKPNKNE
eukprot:TRINITY_DN1132_c0_g1_i1.p1 TRINITY_DN1132_c0_g1~~TRINITY_DN1132_c0_g1_i1.p1  ORF type:complete len:329 (+),score=72.41 TRINITY_DN1132_c0_g1_i1:128-1114(+)